MYAYKSQQSTGQCLKSKQSELIYINNKKKLNTYLKFK